MADYADFVAQVAALLRWYCHGACTRAEENRLVLMAAKVAEQKVSGKIKAAARVNDTSAQQEAASIVGPLFGRTSQGIPLVSALDRWLDADDIELFQRFQAVVVRHAKQELFHRWRQVDHLSCWLWHRLQRSLRDGEHLHLFPPETPRWVMLSGRRRDSRDLASLDSQRLCELAAACLQPGVSIADLIVEALEQAEFDTGQPQVISIEDLFDAMRVAAVESVHEATSGVQNEILHIAVEKATAAARQGLQERLQRYETDGKLMPPALGCFKAALEDILIDCADGGPAISYFGYLSSYLPGLSRVEYRKSYRSRFEYLAEFVRIRFAEVLKDNYDR
ncbi:MAG: hypothetical protein AB1772_00645 [Candidatus Zixiibacteriota bacterium]